MLALLSGGGSSLLTLPAAGLTLPQLIASYDALLACGATVMMLLVLVLVLLRLLVLLVLRLVLLLVLLLLTR